MTIQDSLELLPIRAFLVSSKGSNLTVVETNINFNLIFSPIIIYLQLYCWKKGGQVQVEVS